ncbi:MAG: hypothetical protein OEV71_15525, partial [Nitrospira sp.]|nr:hypothetical protein [Nitrospira sp.]
MLFVQPQVAREIVDQQSGKARRADVGKYTSDRVTDVPPSTIRKGKTLGVYGRVVVDAKPYSTVPLHLGGYAPQRQ